MVDLEWCTFACRWIQSLESILAKRNNMNEIWVYIYFNIKDAIERFLLCETKLGWFHFQRHWILIKGLICGFGILTFVQTHIQSSWIPSPAAVNKQANQESYIFISRPQDKQDEVGGDGQESGDFDQVGGAGDSWLIKAQLEAVSAADDDGFCQLPQKYSHKNPPKPLTHTHTHTHTAYAYLYTLPAQIHFSIPPTKKLP